MFKTIKAQIIFSIVFSVICVITTTILIAYQKIDIEENLKTGEIIKGKDVKGIDLNGTYNQNDLEIEEKSVSLAKREIRYFQISGLKNKNIENKINKEIEETALNCYKDKIKNIDEVVNIQVSMWEAGNFANTISFEMSYYAKIDNNEDDFYQGVLGLNYDLNTGEKITIDKIFTSDTPIENVLRNSAYYSLIKNNAKENLAGNLTISDYGNIEDQIAEIIYKYKSGKIKEFYYTPKDISIIIDDEIINVDMEKYSEYIAIYNRYISEESLYENNEIGMKKIYTLSKRYNNLFYYQNYQKENNYFVDITIDFQSASTDYFAKEIVDKKIIQIENEIAKIKQKTLENTNEFYVMNYYIIVYTGEESSLNETLTSYHEIGNTYEMTVHDFEENIEPIIIKYNRQQEIGNSANYIYDFSDMLKIEPQSVTEYYNPNTGEKIVL